MATVTSLERSDELNSEEFDFPKKRKLRSSYFWTVYEVPFRRMRVALKIFHAGRGCILRDRREIDVMSNISHQNLLRFLGIVNYDLKKCLVFEFASGGSVYDCLIEDKRIVSPEEKFKWVKDVSYGLRYLHHDLDPVIYHGKVKSRNILLFPQAGGDFIAKLGDFASFGPLPMPEVVVVDCEKTPWPPPEVLSGEQPCLKSDVWSYGATVVEIFTLPVASGLEEDDVKKNSIMPLTQLTQQELSCIPKTILEVVQGALVVDRQQRWSMEKICRALEAADACRLGKELLKAVAKGDIEETRRLLTSDSGFSYTDEDGRTSLHWAATEGNDGIGRLLLDAGADAAYRDDLGRTPLHWAAWNRKDGMVSLLLDAGADVACTDKEGLTPLHWASIGGKDNVARLLLNAGADVTCKNEMGLTPLHWAAAKGNEGVARLLLETRASVASTDKWRRTPLHWAAAGGKDGAARLLLDFGADVSCEDEEDRTPLHSAAWGGKIEVARVLLEAGADVTCKDKQGLTPLHKAAAENKHSVARLLLDTGAHIDCTDKEGLTPLHWAAWKDKYDMVRLLLEAGAEVDCKDDGDSTPLHWAAAEGNDGVVRLLLDAGADVNSRDKSGDTPLFLPKLFELKETIRLLNDAGARE